MDVRNRVPNIKQLQRDLSLGSYDKLYEVLAGRSKCSALLARRIEAATAGAIQRWELRPDIFDAPDTHLDPSQRVA